MFRLRRLCGLNLSKSKILCNARHDRWPMATMATLASMQESSMVKCVPDPDTQNIACRILAHICSTSTCTYLSNEFREFPKNFLHFQSNGNGPIAIIVGTGAIRSIQTCVSDSINHNHFNVRMFFRFPSKESGGDG